MPFKVTGAKELLLKYFGGRTLYAALDRNDTELVASSYSAYARVAIQSSAWAITEDSGNSRGQATTNADVNFPTANSSYTAAPTHASLYDSLTGGNQILRDSITVSGVAAGERVRITAGSLTARLTV